MAVATFDTLKFANKLKEVGVPPAQAEAEAALFSEILQVNLRDLVTKDDLRQFEERINARFENFEQRFTAQLIELRQDFHAQVESLRQDLHAQVKSLRQDSALQKQELSAKIDLNRQEQIARSNAQDQESKFLRWMIAAVLTGMVTMLIRSFFFHG